MSATSLTNMSHSGIADPFAVRWVRQEDPEGCGVACLAMVTGDTYANVRATIETEPFYKREGGWDGSTNQVILEHYLTALGWWHQASYESWRGSQNWPPKPFAPFHIANVVQPSNNGHYVVMDALGQVLDPLREGIFKLTDWPTVHNVIGWQP